MFKSKHRKPITATPFTREALVKVQEDARHRAVAAYRVKAQEAFNAAWGLNRGDAR